MLEELQNDALLSILGWLDPRSLVSVGSTCRRLKGASQQDCLWKPHCRRWLAAQPLSAGLGGVELAAVERALGLAGASLYQALYNLGAWPAGLWYASNEEGGWQPEGRLLVVDHCGGSFYGNLVSAEPVPGPQFNQTDIWECGTWFAIEVVTRSEADISRKVELALTWSLPGDAADSLAISIAGDELVVYQGLGSWEVPREPSRRLLLGKKEDAALSDETIVTRFTRLPLGLLSQPAQPGLLGLARAPASTSTGAVTLGGQGEGDGTTLLASLEGIYTACYGPHGMEVLLLRMAGPEDPPPPGCPIAGRRLQGFKLTGDPNVPALNYSFVADAAQCRLGPYDPAQDDPFPQGGFPRPVLSFFQAATVVVHPENRPMRARFKAVGQINQTPGVWDPEFVAATVLVYEEGFRCPFSVVFEDEGITVRHAMDFYPLAIPVTGFDADDSE